MSRFVDEELMNFDDFQLPESSILLLEPYFSKPSFEPETMLHVTNNAACASLCRWFHGVLK